MIILHLQLYKPRKYKNKQLSKFIKPTIKTKILYNNTLFTHCRKYPRRAKGNAAQQDGTSANVLSD
jgi:hypothetical protein